MGVLYPTSSGIENDLRKILFSLFTIFLLMPSSSSHLAGGFLVFVGLYYLSCRYNLFSLSGWVWTIGFFVFMIYALLPDIDKPDSYIAKSFSTELLLITIATGTYYLWSKDVRALIITAVSLLILLALNFLKHRGFFHSPLAGLLLSLPIAYWRWEYAVFSFGGYVTHIALDRVF